MKFMKTQWRNLMMVTYEVDKQYLMKYIPRGCELHLYQDKALVSLVAFEFSKIRIFGIPMPFYRNFPEINLRIYVKRRTAGGWQRGVVFIEEFISHRFPAWIARTVFRENFHVMRVSVECDDLGISYVFGKENVMAGKFSGCSSKLEKGTVEEFIGDNFWAFKKVTDQKTLAFQVMHRPWKMRVLEDLEVSFDFEELYGKEFASAIDEYGGQPISAFYLDGSEVEVTLPRKIE